MFTVTRFCIQSFAHGSAGLVPSDTAEFRLEDQARIAAQAAWRRCAGVALYSVRGEPVQRLWDKPRLLERFGDVLDLETGLADPAAG